MEIKKFLNQRFIITGGVLLALTIGTASYVMIKNKVHYITQPLKRCTITEIVEASGTVNPVNTVSVGSTVSGLIKEIYVDFNSEVKKGQPMAQIDPANFIATVQQNEAQIANAQANLARLQAVMDYDYKMYVRYKNLYAKNFIAKSELDQVESTYRSDLAQINAAKAQIAQYQASLKTAKTNLGYTKIIAPVDGTVISREIDLGQPVAASFQAPQLFTIAQDLTEMQIEVNVSEADIGKVKEGQDVTYTLDGYADSLFKGKVTQVRLASTTTSNVVTYSVIVDVKNEDLKLKPGMTANVSIITNQRNDVLCLPNIALKFTPNTDGKKYEKQGVWVLKHNKPVRYDIKTGAGNDNFTELISKDIKENDPIITGIKGKNTTAQNKRRRGPGMF